MDFVNDNGKIICLRETPAQEGNSSRQIVVVSFDELVTSVPPHVASTLSSEEIIQLELWLKERENLKNKLQEDTMEKTVLETLPAFFQEALYALDEIDEIDVHLFNEIKDYLLKIDNKLNKFQHLTNDSPLQQNEMNDSEVLKERLDIIKNNI